MDNIKTQRGLKRKRNESDNLVEDFSKVSGKLHHGLKDVRRAAKKAKIFETQKLVKKLKGLRKNVGKEPDIVGYDEQLQILKTIEHEAIANTAIKSKIAKDRVLTQHEGIREALAREIGDSVPHITSQNTSAARIHSRLLSSKILSTEISSLCDDLRKLLGHESNKKTRVEMVKDDGPKACGMPKSSKSHETSSSGSSAGTESENADNDTDEQESETMQDEEQPDADSWESGSISIHENSEGEGGEEPTSGNTPLKPLKNVFKQSNTTSTFLPSLSVGFVRGSDESDWSDSEAKIADSDKKKNRRGQRARRAIWEKKYGKNANHKKLELNEQNKRFSKNKIQGDGHGSSYRKTGKQDNSHSSRKLVQPYRHPPGTGNHGGLNTAKKDDQPLHPSWEAKRKLKEKQNLGIMPSQGTKIKFSD